MAGFVCWVLSGTNMKPLTVKSRQGAMSSGRRMGMRAREAPVRACVCAYTHAHLRARRVYSVSTCVPGVGHCPGASL